MPVYRSFSKYQLALYKIDSLRVDGKFYGVDGTIPEGQGIVVAHLNECHELIEMVCSLFCSLLASEPKPIPAERTVERAGRGGGRRRVVG